MGKKEPERTWLKIRQSGQTISQESRPKIEDLFEKSGYSFEKRYNMIVDLVCDDLFSPIWNC